MISGIGCHISTMLHFLCNSMLFRPRLCTVGKNPKKKCNLGKMHRLLQRLKSMFLKKFLEWSSSPKGVCRVQKFFPKNLLFLRIWKINSLKTIHIFIAIFFHFQPTVLCKFNRMRKYLENTNILEFDIVQQCYIY